MNNQPPTNDPKQAWQSQRPEHANMSLNEIQKKVRKVQLRNQLSVLSGLVALFFFGRAFMQSQMFFWRIAWGMVILGTLHMMVVLGKTWSGALKRDAALKTSVQFYRSRLNRWREFRRRSGVGLVLMLSGTMILVGGVAIESLRQPAPPKAILPFCLILAAWGVSYIIIGRRQRRWIKRELETLELLEKEN
jgi:hypothetical protein